MAYPVSYFVHKPKLFLPVSHTKAMGHWFEGEPVLLNASRENDDNAEETELSDLMSLMVIYH